MRGFIGGFIFAMVYLGIVKIWGPDYESVLPFGQGYILMLVALTIAFIIVAIAEKKKEKYGGIK